MSLTSQGSVLGVRCWTRKALRLTDDRLFSDAFGRKWAVRLDSADSTDAEQFNSSLFIAAAFTCLTAASPNYVSVAVFNGARVGTLDVA